MQQGTCKLCLESAALCDSHILPAWSYKRARDERSGNPNPVVVSNGVAAQTSKQTSEHLLCRPCEDRMRPGENYVHEVTYDRRGVAKFTDLVGNVIGEADGVRLATIGRLDHTLLTYFGASVLWRASVAKTLPSCHLGPEYEEAFRRYLLGETTFPESAACLLVFHDLPTDDGSYVGSICTSPATDRNEGHHQHRFAIFGLMYYFAVGKRLPGWSPSGCFARSADHHVLFATQEMLLQWPAPWLAGARVVGKLAKKHG